MRTLEVEIMVGVLFAVVLVVGPEGGARVVWS